MEINKINFEQLRSLGITQSFEDLDVNSDGVINEKDKDAAKNAQIAGVINNLLNAVDEEPELLEVANSTKTSASKSAASTSATNSDTKTSASKNSYGVNETDAANFETDIKNSKGTVYLVMGNLTSCGYCKTLEKEIQKHLSELEAVSNVYNIDWNKNSNLCRDIWKQGGNTGGASFPQIAKFVDGKFVEFIDSPRSAAKAVQNMLDKAEGTPEAGGTSSAGSTSSATGSGSSTASGTTGKKLTDEEKAKLKELREELKTLGAEIEKLNGDIKTLQDEVAELEKQRAEIIKEQQAAQEEADKAKAKLDEEQKTLDKYTKEYDDYHTDIEEVNNEILKEQSREEEEFNQSMNVLVNKAINDYDPAEHGDNFDAYFEKQMDNASFPTFSKLNDLNSSARNLSDEAQTVLGNIKSQSAVVCSAKKAADTANAALTTVTNKLNDVASTINTKNAEITGLTAELKTKQDRKAEVQAEINEIAPMEGGGLTAKEVLAQVSDAEKKLAIDNKVDLTKCVIALGADSKFHIYEKTSEGNYTSLARTYGSSGSGCGLKGADIVPSGSGYMNGLKEAEGEGRAVYTFSSVNCDLTDGECDCMSGCYTTCSPLSFDVDGNGVNTTVETVSYDIDGDGILDTVNNSDEWVLAFDKDGNGVAGENGSELFGNNTDLDGDGKADGYKDGFAALKALARKEGLIGDNDTKLDAADIKKLSEKYGLVMTKGYAGEAKSLADLGITEINLAATDETTLTKNYDARNNDIMRQEGATFVVNGQTREYADIWNAKKSDSEAVYKVPEKPIDMVTARIGDTTINLEYNKDGVIAMEGKVNYKDIKNKQATMGEMTQDIFTDIVEVEEEPEEEELDEILKEDIEE